jgi:hypothetical protein
MKDVYTEEQIEGAYRQWRSLGSIRRAAEYLNFPEGTIMSWCRSRDWVRRRMADDAVDHEIAVAHARMRIVGELDFLIDDAVGIARDEKVDPSVRLNYFKWLSDAIELKPQLQKAGNTTVVVTGGGEVKKLSSNDMKAVGEKLAAMMLGVGTGTEKDQSDDSEDEKDD